MRQSPLGEILSLLDPGEILAQAEALVQLQGRPAPARTPVLKIAPGVPGGE